MNKKEIEDIYPLTPLQEGLLFHAVMAPGEGAYHDQFSAVLRGPLDVDALARAWRTVTSAHAIFRTAFAWQTGKAPLQVVGRRAEAPFAVEDWHGLGEAEQARRREALLAEDVQRGFDPGKAPLTRVTVARLADDAWFLLWSRHHLLLDGWSVSLVLREWLGAYQAIAAGLPAPAVTARPFREYIAWLQRQDAARAEAFWRSEVGDFAQPNALPWHAAVSGEKNESPAETRLVHGEREVRLSATESEAVRELARTARVTQATVFQAAWALVLARLSGERDVLFGHTVSGRPADLAGAESMVGLFINTVPLRVRLQPAQTVEGWLRELQSRALAIREFEHTPLVKIHGWTDVPRDRALFETLLVFENYPVDEAVAGSLGALRVEQAHSHERTHYPATLIVAPGREIGLLLLHDRSKVDDAWAERLLEYVRAALASLAGGLGERVGRLSILGEAERRLLVETWNQTALPHDRTATLVSLFEAQVTRTPDAVALIDGDRRMTYAELAARVRTWGKVLRETGDRKPETGDGIARVAGEKAVRRERLIGVCLERGADLVTALLAVLESGAAYVPLDPMYPAERLAFMVEDAGIELLVTQQSLVGRVPVAEGTRVVLAEEFVAAPSTGSGDSPSRHTVGGGDRRRLPLPAARPEIGPSLEPRPENLAYLIYTSGSTGRPKATAIEHRAAVALVHWAQTVYSPRELKGVLFSTSVCFDLSVFELFVTLASGGSVIVAENALALPALPARNEVTLLNTVPSAAAELARQESLPVSVTTINLAGEPLTAALADRLYAFPQVERVYDLYGPSEDTTYSTCALRERGGPATIGRVIANSQLYLLDADLVPVPRGAVGEIYLGGEGLARGYLGRPELTAERFVPNPFGREPGSRLYRTGDLARFRADGQIEFLGRGDHQVKIRGFRIELGEIQARLEALPGVAEAVVVAREHPQRGKYLAAFVVLAVGDGRREMGDGAEVGPDLRAGRFSADREDTRENNETSVSRLAAALRAALPEYMVPTTWHVLAELPRTPNGKLDRKRLPEDRDTAGVAQPDDARVRGSDPLLDVVAEIWASVFGAAQVGPEANFFELGGHSLLATQVVARVRSALKLEVPLRALFEHPNLRDFVAAVRALRRESGAPAGAEIELVRRPAGLAPPLSFAQQRMWVLSRLADVGTAYHVPAVLEARGPLDLAKLSAAIRTVVSRHEPLRTRFVEGEGAVRLAVDPIDRIADAGAEVAVGTTTATVVNEAEARRCVAAEVARSFDLAREYPWRVQVLRWSEERHWIVFTVHHIATDGWSEATLVREIAAAYAGRPLPAQALAYGDYAAWQRQRFERGELAAQVRAWAEELRGVPALELPTDRARPAVQTHRGAMERIQLSETESTAVRGLARQEGATLFMVLLAAWEVWLWRHAGQTDFAIGTPVAGRTRPELEPLIGLFVNTIVLRADVAPEIPFVELLRRVRARTLRAFERQEAPFEQVVEAVQPERDVSRSALFQVMFSVQNTPRVELELAGLRLSPVELPVETAKFDLTLNVTEVAGGALQLNLEYNRDLFEAATACGFLDRLRVLLESALRAPKTPLRDLSWMPAAELRALERWSQGGSNGADGELAKGGEPVTVLEAVAAQVRQRPEAVAVSLDSVRWSYAELWSRAERVAADLRKAGVVPGEVVGVQLQRSPELVAAMLGVWLAEAAYVPLDPEYPVERIETVRAEAGIHVVVTASGIDRHTPAFGHPAREGSHPSRQDVAFGDPQSGIRNPQSEALAYILYTSGSTGRPKGVAIPHAALAHHMAWFNARYGFGPGDVVLQKTPFTFDASVWEFWAPLMTGGRLELAAPGEQRDPAALAVRMQRTGVTVLQAVPSLFEALAAEREFARVTTLRMLFSGGEALIASLRDRLARVQRVPLVNLYGPTEATIQCATWTCGANDGPGAMVPIGVPAPGNRLWVLDADRRPVAPGVAGELYIGGAQLAAGYWRQPALTAERFVPDPFAGAAGAKLYATGDLVRWRGDGVLEYLGRSDDQVKLRGFRIELGEIETALGTIAGVTKAAAAVRAGQLLGYVQWAASLGDWEEALRRALGNRLPGYMVPARFVRVERWPLLPSGKVDRRALPEPDVATVAAGEDRPVGAVEELLAQLWQELLRVPRVGRRDNFFSLGGDSILALQVASRAAAAGVRVPAQAVFTHQTLAELAGCAESAAEKGEGRREKDGDEGREAGREPGLAPVHRWFFELELAQPEHWNQSALFVTPAGFDVERFERALRQVVARHDAFQRRYVGHGTGVRVLNGRPDESVVCSRAELERLAEETARAQAALDLANGPLLRAVTFAGPRGGEGRLLLVVHHLAIDGVSWRILLEELAAMYASPSAALAPAGALASWFEAAAAEARSASTEAELAFWQAVPAATPLPRDRGAEGRGCGADEARLELALDPGETRALLSEAGAAYRTQINDLLLAALALAMRDWTGATQHTIALEGHGREEFAGAPDVARTIGWFTSLFPLALDLTAAPANDPGAAIKAVKEQMRAVPRRGFGYGLLRHLGRPEVRAALGRQPWPEVVFNYLGQLDATAGEPAATASAFRPAAESRGEDRSPRNARPFLLEVNAAVFGGQLRLTWSYSQAHHAPATIERVAAGYLAALRAIVTHCTTGAAGGFTPSDFSAGDVSQTDLDKLFARLQ